MICFIIIVVCLFVILVAFSHIEKTTYDKAWTKGYTAGLSDYKKSMEEKES